MEKRFFVFLVFGSAFTLLSILVTSQVLYSNARVNQALREIERQYDLIDSDELDNSLIDQLRVSNRSIQKGLMIFSLHEMKLRNTILLLVANGILGIYLVGISFRKNRK